MPREVTPAIPRRDVTVGTADGVRLHGIVVPADLPPVWVVPGRGQAENGMTGPLAERIGRWARDAVGRDPLWDHAGVTSVDTAAGAGR